MNRPFTSGPHHLNFDLLFVSPVIFRLVTIVESLDIHHSFFNYGNPGGSFKGGRMLPISENPGSVLSLLVISIRDYSLILVISNIVWPGIYSSFTYYHWYLMYDLCYIICVRLSLPSGIFQPALS